MTYGWVILVVLAAIGALAYYGVLSPDRFLPEKCTLPSGMACLDFQIYPEGIELTIQNYGNFDMENVSIELIEDNIKCQKITLNKTLRDKQLEIIMIPCEFNNADYYKYKGNIVIEYINAVNGRMYIKIGELIAKI